MPTDAYVKLPDDTANGGKLARTITDTVGGQTVHSSVVTMASTQSSPTLTNVAASTSNVNILASNVARRGAAVFNDCDKILYLKLGVTASTTSHTVQIPAGGYYEFPLPIYTGQCDGIWAAAPTGSARITEIL